MTDLKVKIYWKVYNWEISPSKVPVTQVTHDKSRLFLLLEFILNQVLCFIRISQGGLSEAWLCGLKISWTGPQDSLSCPAWTIRRLLTDDIWLGLVFFIRVKVWEICFHRNDLKFSLFWFRRSIRNWSSWISSCWRWFHSLDLHGWFSLFSTKTRCLASNVVIVASLGWWTSESDFSGHSSIFLHHCLGDVNGSIVPGLGLNTALSSSIRLVRSFLLKTKSVLLIISSTQVNLRLQSHLNLFSVEMESSGTWGWSWTHSEHCGKSCQRIFFEDWCVVERVCQKDVC